MRTACFSYPNVPLEPTLLGAGRKPPQKALDADGTRRNLISSRNETTRGAPRKAGQSQAFQTGQNGSINKVCYGNICRISEGDSLKPTCGHAGTLSRCAKGSSRDFRLYSSLWSSLSTRTEDVKWENIMLLNERRRIPLHV